MSFEKNLKTFFKKKYYYKKINCPNCNKIDYPILKRNRISNIMMPSNVGSDELRNRRKYFLVWPNCKYIISSIK